VRRTKIHDVDVNGQRISYRDTGGQGRPVVFVHGNSSSSRTWQPVMDSSGWGDARLVALDLPGHGSSSSMAASGEYGLPGYARVLASFVRELDISDAVIVGWSLGGHVVLEASPALAGASGFVVFGTPPVASAGDFPAAFLPNPAVQIGFQNEVSEQQAREYAVSFVAPDSSVSLDDFVTDILATDGTAREKLGESLATGQFADELALVRTLGRPLAILHGRHEQLIRLEYLQGIESPALWRGKVQLIEHTGHAPHVEAPEAFGELLRQFLRDIDPQS
jgi:pimeloyl-ACP methyl ester carboxylesterase